MGYMTQYKLDFDASGDSRPSCSHDKPADAKFCPTCGKEVGMIDVSDLVTGYVKANENLLYALGSDLNGGDSCKWYDHENDMRAMSKKFKNCLLTLTGAGEEAGDLWRKYFYNGKMQVAKARIEYDNFDKSKLA